MFNKESERYLSDDHRKNGDQAFESAFSNQGPEFESAFQEEKAEKRHFFLTFVLPLILLSVSWMSVFLSWRYKPIILYLAVIVACFVLAIILFRMGQKLGRFLFTAIVLALIGLSFFATLGGSVYRCAMKKYRLIQQVSQSELDEEKPDSDDPKDYEDKSAIYNWTEEDFENLKPKVDTLRSIIKSHGKGNYVEMESSGLKVDGVSEFYNYSSNWTEEQINSLRTKDQAYLGPITSLSEVVREHPQAKGAWRSIKVHSSGIMHKSVDLDYTDQNSPIEKAQLLRLSFEYNEKKKDYYLSYNSVDRGHW
ncbi:energy-coupling factor transporter transmembrane protein EcfT [Streptococcus salivarius]|uniref:energy-coupling factor transporter transmembrane protein EcfT n=1 Tax=Streptococcus salivarius TaxID=1304 RepID=UPI002000849C